jgi:hypothetical protein
LPSDRYSSLPEPVILGLVEEMSIQQVDLALRLLDEADDREKTHKNFEKLRRTQARRGGLIHFVSHFWSVLGILVNKSGLRRWIVLAPRLLEDDKLRRERTPARGRV